MAARLLDPGVLDPLLAATTLAVSALLVARAAGRRGRGRAGWFLVTVFFMPVGLGVALRWVLAEALSSKLGSTE